MLSRLKGGFILVLAMFFVNAHAFAQCAMCRGSVESTVSAGDTSMASNLNLGILYLFFTPYLLAALIGYLWFKTSRRNAKKIEGTRSFAG